MKLLITAILCFLYTVSSAQIQYDTISFNDIVLNNRSLYTHFKYLKNITSDKENRARVYQPKDISIPFTEFDEKEIIYNISSHNIVYNYSENKDDNVFITYVKPGLNFKIKLGKKLLLKRNINVSSLKKLYPNSYKMYTADSKKNFRLVVKKDNQYAFLDLTFKDNRFQDLYLITE